ncbi:MAG: hypothetical protein L0Y66_09890 [Myxococcaceae bacterium]|nr:hypothetical protein [Myxococcaceae bacterium]MCI0673255.1 hypothetical protein [Myxococcaceae bacterium]
MRTATYLRWGSAAWALIAFVCLAHADAQPAGAAGVLLTLALACALFAVLTWRRGAEWAGRHQRLTRRVRLVVVRGEAEVTPIIERMRTVRDGGAA